MFTSVLLQHNNAQPHSASATITVILKLNSELLPHPLYSQDLASTVVTIVIIIVIYLLSINPI